MGGCANSKLAVVPEDAPGRGVRPGAAHTGTPTKQRVRVRVDPDGTRTRTSVTAVGVAVAASPPPAFSERVDARAGSPASLRVGRSRRSPAKNQKAPTKPAVLDDQANPDDWVIDESGQLVHKTQLRKPLAPKVFPDPRPAAEVRKGGGASTGARGGARAPVTPSQSATASGSRSGNSESKLTVSSVASHAASPKELGAGAGAGAGVDTGSVGANAKAGAPVTAAAAAMGTGARVGPRGDGTPNLPTRTASGGLVNVGAHAKAPPLPVLATAGPPNAAARAAPQTRSGATPAGGELNDAPVSPQARPARRPQTVAANAKRPDQSTAERPPPRAPSAMDAARTPIGPNSLVLGAGDFDEGELDLFESLNNEPVRDESTLSRARGPLPLALGTESLLRRSGVIHWEQGKLLGVGAFGKVYLGTDLDTDELMAVKKIEIGAAGSMRDNKVRKQIAQIENELQVLETLEHENIVRYIGTQVVDEEADGSVPGLLIFMAYVSGGSLAGLVHRSGSLAEEVARAYCYQILNGLRYLHEKSIAHRDIKPANILIEPEPWGLCDKTLKIADFGASKDLNEIVNHTEGGAKTLTGTPHFMAPEVVMQTGHGRKADIWSLGCTLYEMLTGHPPWHDQSAMGVLFRIGTRKEPPPFPEGLSPHCLDAITLMFTRDFRERPTAAELMQHPWFDALFAAHQRRPSAPALDWNLRLSTPEPTATRKSRAGAAARATSAAPAGAAPSTVPPAAGAAARRAAAARVPPPVGEVIDRAAERPLKPTTDDMRVAFSSYLATGEHMDADIKRQIEAMLLKR